MKNVTFEELPELSTDKELGGYVRKSPATLYRMRERGLLPFRRVGGQIMYTKDDIREFLNRCKGNSEASA